MLARTIGHMMPVDEEESDKARAGLQRRQRRAFEKGVVALRQQGFRYPQIAQMTESREEVVRYVCRKHHVRGASRGRPMNSGLIQQLETALLRHEQVCFGWGADEEGYIVFLDDKPGLVCETVEKALISACLKVDGEVV